MRSTLRVLLAAALGVVAAFLVACGGGKGLLASNEGDGLSSKLDSVSVAANAGDCKDAGRAAAELRGAAATLPPTVDAQLRQALRDGADTVAQRAAGQCAQSKTTTTQVPTTTTTDTTATTPSTTTSSTSTSTSTSTPTTTPSTSTTTTSPSTSTATTPSTSTGSGGGSGGVGPGGGGTP